MHKIYVFPTFFKSETALKDILWYSGLVLPLFRMDIHHPSGKNPRHGDIRGLFPLLFFSGTHSDMGLFGPVTTQEPVQTHSMMLSVISGLHKQLLGWPFRKRQPTTSKNDITNLILWKQYLLGLSSPGSFDMMRGEGWRCGGEGRELSRKQQYNLLLGANFSYQGSRTMNPKKKKYSDHFHVLYFFPFLKPK